MLAPDSAAGVSDDALSLLLGDLRIIGTAYGHGRLAAPWGISFPHEGAARLHVVLEGQAWLTLDGEAPQRLARGDAVFLPRGGKHLLTSAPDGKATCVSQLEMTSVAERVYCFDDCDCDRAETVLACCSVTFNEPCLHPLLAMMPPAPTVSGARCDRTLTTLLEAMAEEILAPKIGGATVLTRLADVVVTRLIRSWVEAQSAQGEPWLAALRDPRLGRALAAMHRDPARDWTIAELAKTAGVSRSIFAERFAQTTGYPPARYLARLRMGLASRMLKEKRMSIGAVAQRLGYQSTPAFSRALKRHLGRSPGALRREPAA